LPVVWIHASEELLIKAAEIKSTHPLPLADAWIAACALMENGALVHKDPKFNPLALDQFVLQSKK
jgi:predicted nucleic acid-binding protein